MRQLSEDLKPISYYIKDREQMLHEMFRCVRGPKLQAILPDALKVTLKSFFSIVCHYHYDHYYKMPWMMMRRHFILLFFSTIFWSPFDSSRQIPLIIDPCFR